MGAQRRGSVRIPGWVITDAAAVYKLTAAETLVLITFAAYMRDGVAFVTDALMQESTGLSRPTIQRARPKLVKLGLLEQVSKAGAGRVARYAVPDEMPIPILPSLPLPTTRAKHDGAGWIALPDGA